MYKFKKKIKNKKNKTVIVYLNQKLYFRFPKRCNKRKDHLAKMKYNLNGLKDIP